MKIIELPALVIALAIVPRAATRLSPRVGLVDAAGAVAWVIPWTLRCTCGKGAACPRAGKHPLGRLAARGSLDATEDTIVVAKWRQQAPSANVAIATGTPLGEGPARLGIVDVDLGHNGFASLRALVEATPDAKEEWASMRSAPTVATCGGAHFYVATPPTANFAGAAGTDRAGVDFRGSGGYVVAPPSRHISGAPYRWVTSLEAATLPGLPRPLGDWLTAAAVPAPSSGTAGTRSYLEEIADPALRHRLVAYRDIVVAEMRSLVAAAPNGRQHAALFAASYLVFDLASAGLIGHAEARALLVAEASRMATYDPERPWSDAEIARHVDNAWTLVASRGTAGVALPASLAAALGIEAASSAQASTPSPAASSPDSPHEPPQAAAAATARTEALDARRTHALIERLADCARAADGSSPTRATRIVARLASRLRVRGRSMSDGARVRGATPGPTGNTTGHGGGRAAGFRGPGCQTSGALGHSGRHERSPVIEATKGGTR